MREEILQDENGRRTIYLYDEDDLCLKLTDQDVHGNIVTEIVYFHKGKDTKGWIEFKRGAFVRSYIVDESGDAKQVLVFDREGQLIEESPLDD